jgi:hypothetical protein
MIGSRLQSAPPLTRRGRPADPINRDRPSRGLYYIQHRAGAGSKENTESCREFFHDMRRHGLPNRCWWSSAGAPAIDDCPPHAAHRRWLAQKVRNPQSKRAGRAHCVLRDSRFAASSDEGVLNAINNISHAEERRQARLEARTVCCGGMPGPKANCFTPCQSEISLRPVLVGYLPHRRSRGQH